MKPCLKKTLLHTSVFFGVLIILWTTLFIGALIPNEALKDNFLKDTEYFYTVDAFERTDGEYQNAIQDNYADTILLNIAWNMGVGNPFVSSFDTDFYVGEKQEQKDGLLDTVKDGQCANTDYTRYWHGSAGLIRFFHLFTDVEGIRIIGFAAVLILVAITAFVLIKNKHIDIAVILFIGLIFVQIWNIRLSLEYQSAFVVAFILCPLYLWLERKGDQFLTYLSVAGGAAVAFFDFLTTETVALLLPLLFVVAVRAKEKRLGSLRSNLILLLKCAACWGVAYGATFLVKWTLATVITGESAFLAALSSVGERLYGTAGSETWTFFEPIAANLTVLFFGRERVELGRVAVGSVAFLGALFCIWFFLRSKKKDTTMKNAAISMLVIGAVVFVRFLLLNNHSYLHEFFTYRALLVPIMALIFAAWFNIKKTFEKRRQK